MKRLLWLAPFVLAACPPHLENLVKPQRQATFVLEKDHARQHPCGLGYFCVEGLRKGTYSLVGEDADGEYFMGQDGCVLILHDDRARQYLATGEVPPLEGLGAVKPLPGGGERGGLWLPKPGVNAEPRLFHIARYGDMSYSGAIGSAAAAAGEGEILSFGYGSEKEFVSSLRIVSR